MKRGCKVFRNTFPNQQRLKQKFCFGRSVDHYDADPGGQVIFCGGQKITVTICFAFSTKGLSTLEVQKVIRKKIQKNNFFNIY